ncbi:RPM1-interacting protein 4 [Rhynchospora pubera]|uniref:RPM1-interacting protein 4 n=1 Tax=Rhynchospora pubera TaxID=906938 RepID=A0AAV8CTQ8_9POAL|nr:RPM1-interacting protein 4 [Rhynchospora pubera]
MTKRANWSLSHAIIELYPLCISHKSQRPLLVLINLSSDMWVQRHFLAQWHVGFYNAVFVSNQKEKGAFSRNLHRIPNSRFSFEKGRSFRSCPSNAMAKRASVPQFGTWENQNVGYTMYFEKVRNDKSAGPKKIINPNDPEQMRHVNMGSSSNQTPPSVPKPSQHRPKPEQRQPNYYNPEQRQPNYHQPEQRQPNYHQNYHNQRPNQNYPREPSPEPSPARVRPSPGPTKRSNVVPKFGEWEDVNSTPAGGYTMQFENLKKKKEAAKASPLQLPTEPVRSPERKHEPSFFQKV